MPYLRLCEREDSYINASFIDVCSRCIIAYIINVHKLSKALLCFLLMQAKFFLCSVYYMCALCFLTKSFPSIMHKITTFVVSGLQVSQSLHSHTGSHAEHHRRFVEDGVGVQEQGDGAAVCPL